MTMGCDDVLPGPYRSYQLNDFLVHIYGKHSVPYFYRQLWLVLGVKLMEANSNLFSRYAKKHKFEQKAGMILGGFNLSSNFIWGWQTKQK